MQYRPDVRPGEVERAAVHGRVLEQVELERGDDADGALAAAHRPEQIGLLTRRDPAQHSVTGDDLRRTDVVAGQPVGTRQRALAGAGRVTHHPDVRRRAAQAGQPERRRGGDQLRPLHAGTDPRPPLRVHHAVVEPAGGHQQRAVQISGDAVPGGLDGNR